MGGFIIELERDAIDSNRDRGEEDDPPGGDRKAKGKQKIKTLVIY